MLNHLTQRRENSPPPQDRVPQLRSILRYLILSLVALLVVLLLGCRGLLVTLRSRTAPNVGIVEIAYMMPTGVPVFTITNASPVSVLRSQWCSIQTRTPGGKIDRKEVWLESGSLLPAHQSESFALKVAPTQDTWRVDFQVTKWGLPERLHLCPGFYNRIRSRWIGQDERELLTSRWNK